MKVIFLSRTPASNSTASNLRAIVMMVFAMTVFAISDTLIRLASTTGSGATSGQFILLQGVFGTVIFGWLMKRQGHSLTRKYLLDSNIRFRTLGDLMAASCVVTSLTLLPVGTVSAIIQLQPLLVTIAAVFFLNEKVGIHRWTAVSIGLIGGLIIMRPGLEGFEPASLLMLAGVLGLTIRDIATRKLDGSFSSTAAVLLVSMALLPTGFALHYLLNDQRGLFEIELIPLTYLVISSIAGIIAYYVLVLAMRIGEVSAIAPYRYSRLIAAFIIAWLILGETPDFLTLLGSAIVVVAGVTVVLRERQLGRRATI